MGVNYYCKEGNDLLHIGKSSYGWQFVFRAYPEKDIFSRRDWIAYMIENQSIIVDEGQEEISLQDFIDKTNTEKRQKQYNRKQEGTLKNQFNWLQENDELGIGHRCYTDYNGYCFDLREFS